MNKQVRGFWEFVRKQGVVGLAVGLAIGTQVGKVVESIVTNLVNPVVGFIIGNSGNLENLRVVIKTGKRHMTIGWGSIVSSLITLLAVSLLIYLVVVKLRLHENDKPNS